MIDQLVEVERAPQTRMRSEQTTINLQKNALASVTTQLKVLKRTSRGFERRHPL